MWRALSEHQKSRSYGSTAVFMLLLLLSEHEVNADLKHVKLTAVVSKPGEEVSEL